MRDLDLLHDASVDLIRTVDGLDDEALAGPSALPGWTRAHVVAHLALNAEGLARAVDGARRGQSVPQYDSDEVRDADIEELAAEAPPVLRERFLASVTRLADVLAAVRDDEGERTLERDPGGTRFALRKVPAKRLTEVALHHVDLDAGHDRADLSPEVAGRVVDALVARAPRQPPTRLHAVDLDRTWAREDAGPVVSGTAADLAWWLSGRGPGDGLSSTGGAVPPLDPW